jgi:hypothetical protein
MHKYTDQSLASPNMIISLSKRVKGLNEDVFVTQLVVRAEAIDLEAMDSDGEKGSFRRV